MHRNEYNEYEEDIDINELFLDAAAEGGVEKIDRLLEEGADINYQNNIGYTALIKATENNQIEVVRRLLQEEGVDPLLTVDESEDAIGGSALHIAAYRGYDDIVNILLEFSRKDINTHEYCGYTPLHETILTGNFSTFKLLLSWRASYEETTEDSPAITGTPEGLNALGLIMHELIDSSSNTFILIKMLVYLVEHYKVEFPRRKFFEHDTEFYNLVLNNLKKPTNLYKELLSFFDITEKKLKEISLNGVFGDYNELSDSDSEEERDYQYQDKLELHRETVENKIKSVFSEGDEPVLIPHFRGMHFYPRYFNGKGRRLERKLADKQASGAIAREPLFCDAAHELAGISYQLPECDNVKDFSVLLSQRSQKLAAQSHKVAEGVQLMQAQSDVDPCLINTKREHYESRYHEYIQRYVNSYAALKADMEEASAIDLSKIRSSTQKEKFTLLKRLGFTKLPFISTTEDDHWAFEYAFSLVCYDKQTEFRPTKNTAIQPLQPCYLPNGRPRFPYLGVVYATLHTTTELESGSSERILDLFAQNAIDTRCAAPGGHVTGGYIRAKERIFVNTIDAEHIFVGLVVRVPNLSQTYQVYMQEKYGLTEQEFNKFKENLLKAGNINEQTSTLRNEKLYFRTQLKIIEKVIAHQEKRLLEFLEAAVNKNNLQLKMFGATTDELVDPVIRDAKNEKMFIKKFVNLRTQSKNSMFNAAKRERDQDAEKEEERPQKRPRKK